MPQKSGKTTHMNQICAATVESERKALYIGAEQGLEADMAQRVLVLASGWLASKWEKLNYDPTHVNVPNDIRQRLAKVMPIWIERWQFLNAKRHNIHIADTDDLFDQIEEKRNETGFDPDIIVIDWWGRLCDRFTDELYLRNPGATDAFLRFRKRSWLQRLKDRAEAAHKPVCVTHQLAGAEAGKSSKHLSNAYQGQEDKNMSAAFDIAFVSSSADKDKNVTHKSDVARRRGNIKYGLRIDWEHCQLVPKKGNANIEASTLRDLDDDAPPPPEMTREFEGSSE